MSLPATGGTKHTRENENDMEEGIGRQCTEATSNRSSPTAYCSMAYLTSGSLGL